MINSRRSAQRYSKTSGLAQYDNLPPDKEREFMFSCDGKIGYIDRASAKREQRRLQTLRGDKVDIYRCDKCGKLHIGHQGRSATQG